MTTGSISVESIGKSGSYAIHYDRRRDGKVYLDVILTGAEKQSESCLAFILFCKPLYTFLTELSQDTLLQERPIDLLNQNRPGIHEAGVDLH